MSKIFRLYKEGTTTYEDWNNSPSFPYNSASRDTIEDPDGEHQPDMKLPQFRHHLLE